MLTTLSLLASVATTPATPTLQVTVKSLVVQSEGQEAMNRYSAVANGREEADGEIRFMEYSS